MPSEVMKLPPDQPEWTIFTAHRKKPTRDSVKAENLAYTGTFIEERGITGTMGLKKGEVTQFVANGCWKIYWYKSKKELMQAHLKDLI